MRGMSDTDRAILKPHETTRTGRVFSQKCPKNNYAQYRKLYAPTPSLNVTLPTAPAVNSGPRPEAGVIGSWGRPRKLSMLRGFLLRMAEGVQLGKDHVHSCREVRIISVPVSEPGNHMDSLINDARPVLD